MKTNPVGYKSSIAQFGVHLNWLLLCAVTLTSCQFGKGDDGAAIHADKRRQIDYRLDAAFPCAYHSVEKLVDLETDGLNVSWGETGALAVFGKEFVAEKDTVGSASVPESIKLGYNVYQDGYPKVADGSAEMPFKFKAWAKHGIGPDYATTVSFLYPASAAKDRRGNQLKADAEVLPLDFTHQDGTLQTIADSCFCALGVGRCEITKDGLVITDAYDSCCHISSHDHSQASGHVMLEPKMAIVRLSLAVFAEMDYTLNEFLRSRTASMGHCHIGRINITNISGYPISEAELNLTTGRVSTTEKAEENIMISSSCNFINLTDIPQGAGQSLADLGGDGDSWGTSVYLALPCTDEGKLLFSPLIEVFIDGEYVDQIGINHLYGVVSPIELVEGGYYVTEPVTLAPDYNDVNYYVKAYRADLNHKAYIGF